MPLEAGYKTPQHVVNELFLGFARNVFETNQTDLIHIARSDYIITATPENPVAVRPIGEPVGLIHEGVFYGEEWMVLSNARAQVQKFFP